MTNGVASSSQPARRPGAEPLSGPVERITFHSAETGYCVLRVKVRGQRDLVTVVGHAAAIGAGEHVEAMGVWINDRQHGLQFKADSIRTTVCIFVLRSDPGFSSRFDPVEVTSRDAGLGSSW